MTENEQLAGIHDIIVDHKGKENRISSGEIGPKVGIMKAIRTLRLEP